MTRRLPSPAAPGPLEGYAARFDDLFGSLAQRRGFREYLAGLLAPRDRNKTLTALAGAEPLTGAQHRSVQRLQFFLSESRWDPERVNARRLELLLADPATAPHDAGVLVIDDSGDRKDGTKTAHVGHSSALPGCCCFPGAPGSGAESADITPPRRRSCQPASLLSRTRKMLSNENNCDETALIYGLMADVPRQYAGQRAAVVVRWNYEGLDDRGD